MLRFKTCWKTKGFKPWFFVSVITSVILIAAVMVVTLHPFLYGTVNAVFGRERRVLKSGDPSQYTRYESDYDNKADTLAAANKLNERICEEGIVLLKNEARALPLDTGTKLTVFGKNSTDLVLGGSGSNAGSAGASGSKSIYDALSAAGIDYNPTMKSFYEGKGGRPSSPAMGSILTGFPIGETPVSEYTKAVRDSYAAYGDAALVVFSRIGGEGYDLPRSMFWDGKKYTNWKGTEKIPGARSERDHYLQLDGNETDMLKEACAHFDKVIVVINSASTMELGFLDDPTHYAYSDKIKAALWIGNPGKTGVLALGRILNGTVNPSGRTVDTYARDFRNDPTWNNFGNYLEEGGNRYYTGDSARNAYFVRYEEGIYVGYRYYETRGYTEREAALKANPDAAETELEAWYDDAVVYPFGYGLSYTDFEWTVVSASLEDGATLPADGTVELRVRVTNTGTTAGKEVVQLYYTAPYTPGGIEKAHVVLGDYAKTDLIAPGASDEVTVSLKVRDMASYDYNNANKNDFTGYELDGGDYTLRLMKNAHEQISAKTYSVPAGGYTYPIDDATKNPVANRFDDVSGRITEYMSRADFAGTFPDQITDAERQLSNEEANGMTYRIDDDPSDPWYAETAPKQSGKVLSSGKTKVKLYDLIGKGYDDPLWGELLDQLTVGQMSALLSRGNYRTGNIDNIEKPLTIDADGPMGFALFMGDPSVYDTCYYASECVLAASFNVELAGEMGRMIGNEGIIGNEKGDGTPYSGWYAPAVNIHRSQFSGRNFEYYSEDAALSSKTAVAVVKGARSKGIYTYVKHFALNDQETNRDTTGLVTWASEQSMRELYFKPFEAAVKDGGTTAMMSAFNRIGFTWAGGSYALLTEVLRDEWGFNGTVITDYNLTAYMNVDQMIRAGGDLNLSQNKDFADTSSATARTALRKATKNVLYTIAGSCAMNGYGPGVVYRYARPVWWLILVWCVVGVIVGFLVWGFFVFRKIYKNTKADKTASATTTITTTITGENDNEKTE